MAAPEFPVVRFYYRMSDGAWLMRMDTGGRPMSMTVEQARAHASAEYGFPVGIVEVDDIPNAEVHEQLGRATHWGGKPPAKPHIDHNAPERLSPPGPPPSFKDAQTRMTEAYHRLFELEQTLRLFVEQVLEAKYHEDWWQRVPKGIRDAAEDKEQRPTNLWFEDYSKSRLRFTELDHLRRIVDSNWPDFRDYLEDKEWFDGRMQFLTRPRHRIAHVNTISQKDVQEFTSDADRILRLIRPRTRL